MGGFWCRRAEHLKVSGTYELPIGPGKKYFNNKGVTGQILGGWQVAGSWTMRPASRCAAATGQITENGDPYPGIDFGTERNLRPDRVAV